MLANQKRKHRIVGGIRNSLARCLTFWLSTSSSLQTPLYVLLFFPDLPQSPQCGKLLENLEDPSNLCTALVNLANFATAVSFLVFEHNRRNEDKTECGSLIH